VVDAPIMRGTVPGVARGVSPGIVRGSARVPPSKSLTHRAYALALLAGESVTVERPLDAEDTRLFLAAVHLAVGAALVPMVRRS